MATNTSNGAVPLKNQAKEKLTGTVPVPVKNPTKGKLTVPGNRTCSVLKKDFFIEINNKKRR
jgi:hypothetical protein